MGIIKKFYITKFKKDRPKIELKNISLSFNKRQILDNISLTVREGEILGLLGPNGVGKSTIFNIIVGLLKPDYGDIYIDKKKVTNLPIYKRALDFKVSIVPQNGGVFTDMTCYQNLRAIADLVVKDKYTGETATRVALADSNVIEIGIQAAVDSMEPLAEMALSLIHI